MRGKLWFVGGLAVGFVLGARAGRERYEELVLKGRKVLDHPTVQEAAGVAQTQANRLYTEGKDRLSHTRLGEKLSTGDGGSAELGSGTGTYADSGVGSGTKTSSSGTVTAPASRAASSGSGANGTTF
ncbi:hypothetical protein [Plantactinospora soyae]|uniref:YtxH domain-containing protein n=1 Tax=Plantactinospora soyae TaxID=1544732 RepID=A0A927RAW6_9ACTN|nr:hypothetical protein [Plantactinospora soyae]MBE1492764.1 hypothetical protein [Plantactinospora soyae]